MTPLLLSLALACAVEGSTPSPSPTGLADASAAGNRSAVARLLREGAAPSQQGEGGVTPLHRAISGSHDEVVALLLQAGADPNAVYAGNSGATPLMLAAEHDDAALATRLIDAGARPDLVDVNGDSALNWAAYYGHVAFSQVLLSAGADPEVTGHGNALQIALRRGHQPLVRLLATRLGVWHEASGPAAELLDAIRADDAVRVAALVGSGSSPRPLDEAGRPAIALAAREGRTAALAALLAAGAAVDDTDPIGNTPLMEAAREGRLDAVEILLQAGADVSRRALPAGLTLSALHYAAIGGSEPVVRRLARAGGALDAQDRIGNTPLMWAFAEQKQEAIGALLDIGADPDVANQQGDSVTELASRYQLDELRARIAATADRRPRSTR